MATAGSMIVNVDVSDPEALAYYARRCSQLEVKLADLREVEAQRMKMNTDLARKCDELHKKLHAVEMSRRPSSLVYLASPYTHIQPEVMEARYQAALEKTAQLTRQGAAVFSPIVHSHPMGLAFNLPQDWSFWERVDRAFIAQCSELLVLCLPGWEQSTGVRAEIAIAHQLGIPVRMLPADLAAAA